MTMKLPTIAAMASLMLGPTAVQSMASSLDEDCRAPGLRSADRARGTGPASENEETLTERLASCGSVLDPPRVGDPDLVETPPKTNDPINIHPQARPGTSR